MEVEIFNKSLDSKILCQAEAFFDDLDDDEMAGWRRRVGRSEELVSEEISQIKKLAEEVREKSRVLVCVGIGGSYLGHRAVLETFSGDEKCEILYAGNSFSAREMKKVLDKIGERDFSVNVISKSGTTLEPAMAFSVLKQKLVEKYGEKEAYNRIIATTDEKNGVLAEEALKNGYKKLVIPDDVGGRYSVFTGVGLFPMAMAGVDIESFYAGAREELRNKSGVTKYATFRREKYLQGCFAEILASFEPGMCYFNEWWKQLFGESEGKNHGGLFPASVIYSTDLHSMGQLMQDGPRGIFETVVEFSDDEDALMLDKDFLKMNKVASMATKIAHRNGGIEVAEIKADMLDMKNIGKMMMFFMQACAVSAKLNGVNPYDQPGVEEYKREMKNVGRG